jgi:hypothetical protein
MRFELAAQSRVFVDLRASGLLRAVGHDPTLTARPEVASMDLETPFVLRFPVRDIEPPRDIPEADRMKMADNLRGEEVLDASRFPVIEVRARYGGTPEAGRIDGDLVVRGKVHPFGMDVRSTRDGEDLVVSGRWEGTLRGLGIKPFKALLGALTLKDWIALRLEARGRLVTP